MTRPFMYSPIIYGLGWDSKSVQLVCSPHGILICNHNYRLKHASKFWPIMTPIMKFISSHSMQALFQLHTLIFGLDVLGNPVSVVRGVVTGAIDLFYEPIKVYDWKYNFLCQHRLYFIGPLYLHTCREVSLGLKNSLKGWALV